MGLSPATDQHKPLSLTSVFAYPLVQHKKIVLGIVLDFSPNLLTNGLCYGRQRYSIDR